MTEINAKIKHNKEESTTLTQSNPLLQNGEIVFTVISSEEGEQIIMMKSGDGVNRYNNLPWISALAADVYDWAKSATKPVYTAAEVGALPSSTLIPSKTSQLTNDSNFIKSTDTINCGSW